MDTQPLAELKRRWDSDGYVVIEGLLSEREVDVYHDLVNSFFSGDIDTSAHRHDLGSNEAQKLETTENITQIMWPSEYADLIAAPLHARCLELAKVFMGDDAVFDFDMLIYKAAHTATDVPWHSDEGYWPDMPDKRAASFWVALTDVHPDMGSMWFVPGSHKEPLLPHRHAVEGEHVMCVDGVTEADGVATSLRAGSCTVHSGRTLHYTRGNSTDRDRPAFIANYRPESMVQWERENGFDHGRGGVGVFLPDKE